MAYRLLGSALTDLAKAAGGLVPSGGDAAGAAGGQVTTAALQFMYEKEAPRIQKMMDDSDVVIIKAGSAIDWTKWAVGGLAAAGVYYLMKRAGR